MKVKGHKKVEGCLEATNVTDIFLDSSIDQTSLNILSQIGKLVVYNEIDNPFFKIIVKGKYTIKGSIGNKSLRILLPENSEMNIILELIDIINKI